MHGMHPRKVAVEGDSELEGPGMDGHGWKASGWCARVTGASG